jgi:hypothetical protein
MSGVERNKLRVKSTGEVFTPTELVREMLSQIPNDQFDIPGKKFLDSSCGDGQFLGEILIRKLESLGKNDIEDLEFKQALSSIYGVDLMVDNVDLCRERLLCGREELRNIVKSHIVCYDALEYDYKFAQRKTKEIHFEERSRKKAEHARKKAEKDRAKQEKIDRKEAHLKTIFGKKIPEIS